MILLLVLLAVVGIALLAAVLLLGFTLAGENRNDQLAELRLQAVQAERQLHDLTRSAFVAMAEAAERRDHDDKV